MNGINLGVVGLCAAVAGLFAGCAQPATGRPDPKLAGVRVDLSGEWLDADSRRAADKLVGSCLSHGWRARYARASERPAVVVLPVKVRGGVHFNSGYLRRLVVDRLRGSGAVDLVEAGARSPALAFGILFSAAAEGVARRALRHELVAMYLVDARTAEVVWTDLYESRRLLEYTGIGDGRDPGTRVRRLRPDDPLELTPSAGRVTPGTALGPKPGSAPELATTRGIRAGALAAATAISAFARRRGGRPVIRIYPLRNRTNQHVNGASLLALLQWKLHQLGAVRLSAGSDVMDELRSPSSAGSAEESPAELAPTLILTSDLEQAAGRTVLRVRLVDAGTATAVWGTTVHVGPTPSPLSTAAIVAAGIVTQAAATGRP